MPDVDPDETSIHCKDTEDGVLLEYTYHAPHAPSESRMIQKVREVREPYTIFINSTIHAIVHNKEKALVVVAELIKQRLFNGYYVVSSEYRHIIYKNLEIMAVIHFIPMSKDSLATF
jgi:glutamate synthase domain-containing protein 1